MKIALLNLARFGDLLQSQAAIRDLAGQGHDVAVVCLENFSGAARLLSGVSQRVSLPGAVLLGAAPSGGPMEKAAPVLHPWHHHLAELAVWKEEFEASFSPDVLCNFTPSISARMLTRYMAGSKPCAGFFVDSHGFGQDGNPWAIFLRSASLVRGASPYNIVDIFRKCVAFDSCAALGAGDASLTPPCGQELERARQGLYAEAPAHSKGFVAVQLGASRPERQWPVEYFAAVGGALWRERQLCPVLLGSEAESALAKEYAALTDAPFISMCGRTTLNELAALLCVCRMLLTNDTGTMHLAAGLGTPIVALFLATAQPFDTGPYLPGSLCLEPDLPCHPCGFQSDCPHKHVCRTAIKPDVVTALAFEQLDAHRHDPVNGAAPDTFSGKGTFFSGGQCRSFSGARVWQSRLDRHGFMDLLSLSGHEDEARTVWLRLLREHLRPLLNEEDDAPVFANSFCYRVPDPLRAALVESLRTSAKLCVVLLEQGRVLMKTPAPVIRDRFLKNWEKIHSCLQGETHLAALGTLWAQTTQDGALDLAASLRRVARFAACLHALEQAVEKACAG